MAVTAYQLREAIASALYHVSAGRLPDVCVGYGLDPGDTPEAMGGKERYVLRRLSRWELPSLADLGRRVFEDFPDERLGRLVAGLGVKGVDGELKNIIFAADGPKPRIVLADAVNNTISIVENAEYCLVFDEPLLSSGLTWRQLSTWWVRKELQVEKMTKESQQSLHHRLRRSLGDNAAELALFDTYAKRYPSAPDTPALMPQVYLHYDPYTRRELGTSGQVLVRERMDFLLLLPGRIRIVLEIDGRQHYSDDAGQSRPSKYAEMMRADRLLRLDGYEVYRFGGAEFTKASEAVPMLDAFFDNLFDRYEVASAATPD